MQQPVGGAQPGKLAAAPSPQQVERWVDDRASDGVFRVAREVFTDAEIFELEMRYIWEGTWLFLGLESQIPKPHDFFTTMMGRQPVLVSRGADGQLGAFLNSCRHRGAILAVQREGHAPLHMCRYHGWTFDSSGRNAAVAQAKDGQYPPAFEQDSHDLTPIARLDSYRGLIFGSLSGDVPRLEEHLGEARRLLDLVVDQSPQGVEYVPGEVSYTYEGNWKLQFENGLDYYHFAATHASYMDVMNSRLRTGMAPPLKTYEDEQVEEATGTYTFAHGHALMYAIRKQGRVHVRPLANDPGAIEEIRARVGEHDAKWMLRQRNLTIFPNLQIVDISSQQLRTWRPLAPGLTEMSSHCLAPVGEGDEARAMRIRNYEDFFNPAGLGTSDDNLMYEYVQSGYAATSAGPTQGYVRGLGQPLVAEDPHAGELRIEPDSWAYGPIAFGDETCFHAGYREWKRLIASGLVRDQAGEGA